MCWDQGKLLAASDADERWRREVERLGRQPVRELASLARARRRQLSRLNQHVSCE